MFKKSLSVIIALLMIVSCMSTMIFTASAETYTPEGTGISSLSEITDMSGKYYLTADIGAENDLSATQISTAFKGTLDGKDTNGVTHTIYTSVPIFKQFGGTVKNLKISGEITATAVMGALCIETAKDGNKVYITSVENSVKFTVSGGSYPYVGGFIGQPQDPVEFTDCVYNGSINAEYSGTSQCFLGGFIGRNGNNNTFTESTKFVRCTNSGNITVKTGGYALVGGFVGNYYMNNDYTFESCTNTGDITTKDNSGATCKAGGFVGVCEKNYAHNYIGCVNNGDIDAYGVVGGLAGQDNGSVTAKGCINNGTITLGRAVAVNCGGMIGSMPTNTASSLFENCVNMKDITSTSTDNTELLGGMVGNLVPNHAEFRNCVNKGNVSCSTVGTGIKIAGIVGAVGGGNTKTLTAVGCVNYGTITSTRIAGGIVGNSNATDKYIACVNRGTISAAETKDGWFGGIAGNIAIGTFYSCINNGSVSAGDDDYAAGIAGVVVTSATLKNCENFGAYKGKNVDAFVVPYNDATVITKTGCNDQTGVSDEDTTVSLDFEGVQRSIPGDNETTFSLRFISKITNIEKYKSTGVMVYKTESGASGAKYTDSSTATVYTQINGMENGVNKVYPETTTAGTYYSALTVTGISVSGTYSFIVVPYTIDLDGNYAYADAYTVTVTDGEIVSVTALAPAPAASN